jgi:signal transduction histidine kinase
MAELFKEELKLNALEEFREELEEFGFDLQILDEKNQPVVQSDGWTNADFSIEAATLDAIKEAPLFQDITIREKPYMLFSRLVQLPSVGVYSLHLIRSERPIKEFLSRLLYWMIAIKSFMVLLAGCLGYLFAGRTLRADEEAHTRLKNFTADASHELRIPLTSLRGQLEVALRKDRSPAEYKEALQDALEEAENLSRLTTDLLWLARNDADQMRLNVHRVSLKTFLEEVIAQAQALPNDKNVQIELGPVNNVMVVFDPDRIKQLLLNLIENALRYGSTNGKVSVNSQTGEGQIIFLIEDNGMGMAPAELTRIFERFYRVDKARSREQGGSGLGLAIVKSIAHAHGGNIEVQSQEGQGSLFRVTLPQPS